MRTAASTDFAVEVDGIGEFRFARRTMRDQFKIDTEIARLTGGLSVVPDYLAVYANAFATIIVMASQYPEGWDPEKLDPAMEESFRQVIAVHAALRDKEDTFRGKPSARVQAGGQDDGGIAPVLVPGEVPLAADGPAVP